MIENMGIAWIDPHPDNPRKDLGDLSELVASIKANGILQNLTIVKASVGYRVVIGHRRLAAAKLAGLTEVPCVISDMDHKQQVATMLTENMQRSDLTIYEQAKGLQMLLDFGESLDAISKQTGFSETTIRRRVKLLELDPEKFKKAMTRSTTLQDYVDLEQIKSLELRNSVLESIGTGNFQWKLKSAIDQEKKDQYKAALIDKLKTFATEIKNSNGYRRARYLSYVNNELEQVVPTDAGEKKYFYLVGSYDIGLFTEETETKTASPEADNHSKMRERCKQLDEINKRAYQLRFDFIKDFKPKKQHASIIMEFAVRGLLGDDQNYISSATVLEMLGGIPAYVSEEDEEDDDKEPGFEAFAEVFAASPEKVLLVATYMLLDSPTEKFHSWQCRHWGNKGLETVYDILERLGYQISHEELQLIDGTHELYEEEAS